MKLRDFPQRAMAQGDATPEDLTPEAAANAIADIAASLDEQLREPSDQTLAFVDAAFERLNVLATLGPRAVGLSRAYSTIAQYHFLCARPFAGLDPARQAVAAARIEGDPRRLRSALTLLAVLLSETAAMPQAHAALNEALDCAEQMEDAAAQCAVWNQIGLILQLQGRSEEAADAFTRELQIADRDPALLRFRSGALANIALASTDVDAFIDRGLRAAHAALALAGEPRNAAECQNRVSLEVILTRLLLQAGDTQAARRHAQDAGRYADRSGMERADAMAKMGRGLSEVAAGNIDVGLTLLRAALELARRKVPALVLPALQAIIRGYELARQSDVAAVYLAELLRLNQESKQAMLLEHHHKHVQALLAQHDGDDEVAASLTSTRTRLKRNLSHEDMRSMTRLLEDQAILAEQHDDNTGKHCFRVGRLASLLGKTIGLDDEACFLIDLAARLHDVGKIYVPDALLLKQDRLTDEERAIMQNHTISGAQLLAKANVPAMHIAEEIALHHHERWDGAGYPMKLAGSSIPMGARVTALADVFDALTHERPYKRRWTEHDALQEIQNLRGKAFDPNLTDAFLKLVPRLRRRHGDLDAYLAEGARDSEFIANRQALAHRLKAAT